MRCVSEHACSQAKIGLGGFEWRTRSPPLDTALAPGSPSASHLAAARASATPATMCSSSDCKAGRSNFACVKKGRTPWAVMQPPFATAVRNLLGIRKFVPVLLSHCAQGNGSYADKRPNGRESCTRHKRVRSPADASAHAGRLCRSYSASFSTPRYRGEFWRATICVSRCAHTNALIGRMVDYGLPSRPTRTACG